MSGTIPEDEDIKESWEQLEPPICPDCGTELTPGQLTLWGACKTCENARLGL